MGKELIVEIGTEEIPAALLSGAINDLSEIACAELGRAGLKPESVHTYGTPRRIALLATGLPDKQPDKTVEVLGPPTRIAFDEKGAHTKAALGFAKSQGVDPKDLAVIENHRGEFVGIRKEGKGARTVEVLNALVPKIILSIPFQKSMRWGTSDITFVRPIRWLLAVFGGEPLTFSIDRVSSGNISYGHRFLSPDAFSVSGWNGYTRSLAERYVVLDHGQRKEDIRREVERIARGLGGRVEKDEELLDTVTNLVEYPVVLAGSFEEEFLRLPSETLISVMKKHQKYFHIYSAGDKPKSAKPKRGKGKAASEDGRLLANFIFVSGTKVPDPEVVVRGNERVIRARFTDAKFFYEEDTKTPLIEKKEALRGMVFLSGLGTYWDKTLRLQGLAEYIGESLGLGKKKITALKRAAELSKADLTTQMVFELPELEGTMGKYYALSSKEPEEVALAIEEHYMPRTRDGRLPQSELGAILSITDKVDNICACFTAGLTPTGTSDPYALRRQAIAVINIILARELTISITAVMEKALELIKDPLSTKGKGITQSEDLLCQIQEFFAERFRNIMTSNGYSQDIVNAVTSTGFDDALIAMKKIDALSKFTRLPDFEPLAIAFKRVVNIVGGQPRVDLKRGLLAEEAEKALMESFLGVGEDINQSSQKGDFPRSLELMKCLKDPVDKFFDNVLVMDKDERLRLNRLALLWEIRDLFFTVADFSKITT